MALEEGGGPSNTEVFSKRIVSLTGMFGCKITAVQHLSRVVLADLRPIYTRSVPMMMYGFGDARFPDHQSVDLMENLVVGFLTDLCHRCRPAPYHFPASRNYPYTTRAKVKIDDLKFALRKDEKKLARLEELVYLEGVISGAKKILSLDVIDDDVARQVERQEKEHERDQGDAGGRVDAADDPPPEDQALTDDAK